MFSMKFSGVDVIVGNSSLDFFKVLQCKNEKQPQNRFPWKSTQMQRMPESRCAPMEVYADPCISREIFIMHLPSLTPLYILFIIGRKLHQSQSNETHLLNPVWQRRTLLDLLLRFKKLYKYRERLKVRI